MTEYWAHTYYDDPERESREVVDDDFNVDALLAEINAEAESEGNPDDWEDIEN